jgi:hypothetical protein
MYDQSKILFTGLILFKRKIMSRDREPEETNKKRERERERERGLCEVTQPAMLF